LIEEYPMIMLDRSVEGIIAIDTPIEHPLPLPVVVIAGHRNIEGFTNVILDHRRAAELALGHLVRMGHREIAFMKGPKVSSDSEVRWQSICEVAKALSRMGEIAARTLLDRLRRGGTAPSEVAVEPELVVRESTTSRLRPSSTLQREDLETPAAST